MHLEKLKKNEFDSMKGLNTFTALNDHRKVFNLLFYIAVRKN